VKGYTNFIYTRYRRSDRTVTDAAIYLLRVSSVDNMDAVTVGSKRKRNQIYLKYLDSKFLAGKRIVVKKNDKVQIIYCMPFKTIYRSY
jgi:hypothetical protein